MGRWTDWWRGAREPQPAEGIRAGRQILERMGPRRLAHFDASMRARSLAAPEWFPSLLSIKPHDVQRLARLTGDAESTGVILAAHPSGWVRQAALPLLDESSTPLALGMLVLRANDWVDAIRQDAQSRLVQRVAVADADPLLAVLPAVERLARVNSRSTAFARDLLRAVTDRLTAAVLAQGLQDPDRSVRRSCARLLVIRGVTPPEVVDLALRQDDPETTWVLAAAAVGSVGSSPLCRRLLAARTPRLRRLALACLIERGGQPADDAARQALADRDGHVRKQAQEHVAASGGDLRAFYGGLLPAKPAVAILGLAETGEEADVERILSYASNPTPGVRAAVAVAIARLNPRACRRTLRQLAGDPSARVARTAVSGVVSTNPDAAELDALWALVTTAPADRIVPKAFQSLDRWVQLTYAFRALASAVAGLQGSIVLAHVMRRWNSSFTAPSRRQADELASLLPLVLRRLEPEVARELEFTVKGHLTRP
jgi:HEAT repeat protein